MFDIKHQILNKLEHKYQLFKNDTPISFEQTLKLWQENTVFRTRFIQQLKHTPFTRFRFETPPVTNQTLQRPFEFVVIDSPWLTDMADAETYQEYFAPEASSHDIISFNNLGNDALLIAPSPRTSNNHYTHIAAFMRGAPDRQIHALWQCVGKTMQQKISHQPLWLNTAGGGVAWLHLRLDSYPKYYAHKPYKHYQDSVL